MLEKGLVLALALARAVVRRCGAQAAGAAPAAPRPMVPDPAQRIDAPVTVLVCRLTPDAEAGAVRVVAEATAVSSYAVEAGGALVVLLPDGGGVAAGCQRVAAEACSPVRCDLSERELPVGVGGSPCRRGAWLGLVLYLLEAAALWLLARS